GRQEHQRPIDEIDDGEAEGADRADTIAAALEHGAQQCGAVPVTGDGDGSREHARPYPVETGEPDLIVTELRERGPGGVAVAAQRGRVRLDDDPEGGVG